MLDLKYPALLQLLTPYLAPKRNESASFLIWFLVNYYRLDEIDAVDAVCDQMGDKGVDGIYVNDGAGTIDIFQSKISQKQKATIGDTQLKEFSGTLNQFSSKVNIETLITGAGAAQVATLVKRLNLIDRLDDYEIRGIFVSNSILDANGADFLAGSAHIHFVGAQELNATFVSDKKDSLQVAEATFDISGFSVATYTVDAASKAVIAPVSATELVLLSGIEDQSLFSLNVRASLGSTQVNKDIIRSIKNPSLHKTFPLFHNGITILAQSLTSNDSEIRIANYYVVNGCQSLNSLYNNKDDLTEDLRVLTKFIQVDADSKLSEIITSYSNNQNGVKPRDFKSNHPIQMRLQNEFGNSYGGSYVYEIKRGEPLPDGEVITNESAGLNLIAFDLKEPWTTHRKYQVFDEKHAELFGRPEVTADRVVMLHLLLKLIENRLNELDNVLVAKYALTRFLVLYVLRRIFDGDELGQRILQKPGSYVRKLADRKRFEVVVGELLDCLIVDLNLETETLGDDFDYRGKLRDKEYVLSLATSLVGSYQKDLKRKKARSIGESWSSSL